MRSYEKLCKVHGLTRHSVYKNGNSGDREYCNLCQSEKIKIRVEKHRQMAYDMFGRECKICGYSKCLNALEYHHLDPSLKEGNPSKILYRSWDRVVKELSGCVLLCANCHREAHSGLLDLKDFIKEAI